MKEKKHWLRPLKGTARAARHLLLWVDADESQPRLKRGRSSAWDVVLAGQALKAWHLGSWEDKDGLEAILDTATRGKGTLTVWLARGWEDLVLTGLAELLDCGACSWRYAMLDGQKLLIRGLWRGKSVTVTSLANWTGGRWDSWASAEVDETVSRTMAAFHQDTAAGGIDRSQREERYLRTWCACAITSVQLDCPALAPTVAGGALMVWRRWLGPRVKTMIECPANKGSPRKPAPTVIVCPSPFRPERSAQAERHSAYGLLTRQLRRGLVDQPIYCVDMRSAYLLALCMTPLPTVYRTCLYRPSVAELVNKLEDGTGHALVRIDTQDSAYPVRIAGKVTAATGHFWAWLVGAELVQALLQDEVREIHTAYLWNAMHLDAQSTGHILRLSNVWQDAKSPACAAAWRAMYSALVGQFAGRRKRWVDVPPIDGLGRWAQWQAIDCKTGAITDYRCIAGHTQKLVEQCDTSAAVPLLYGSITAWVRWFVQQLACIAGVANVAAIHADSLWVTPEGWQTMLRRMSELRHSPDYLRTKAIYDRAWFSGKSLVVVERKGIRTLKAPGVGDGAVLDEAGKCAGLRCVPWSQCESVQAAQGVRRRKVVFAGQRVIDQYSTPAVAIPIGEPLNDPLMREELLLPLRRERKVQDE